MKKYLTFLLIASYLLLATPLSVHAQIFGPVENPLEKISPGNSYGNLTGSLGAHGGLAGFLSALTKTVVIVAGLFSMFNFIIAGLDYITSQGDPKGTEAARNKMKNSIIGLVIIVGTFAAVAMISSVLFGRYDAILKPTFYGPGTI